MNPRPCAVKDRRPKNESDCDAMALNAVDNVIKFRGAGARSGSSAGEVPKISAGLALGSGAVRGFAHIGVISELVKNGVTISELSGSSMGAVIACMYAAGADMETAALSARELCGSDIFDRRIPFVSVNRGAKLEKYLKRLFWEKLRVRRFEELKTKVFVICADINRGRPAVIGSGGILEALMATSAVPMLFPPYEYGGATYIDGGVLMPLPAGMLKKRGSDVVIGVSVGFSNMIKQPRHILHISAQSIIMMGERILDAQKKEPDVLIEPDFGGIGFWDFSRTGDIVEAGRKAAMEAMPLILARGAAALEAKIAASSVGAILV